MKVKAILAFVAIITAVGLVGAANVWPVLQSAKAAACQEFSTGGVITRQQCSSFTSDDHANASNNAIHFRHTNH